MRRLRSEAEREILTGERYIGATRAEFCRESEIFHASDIKHRRRNLSFIAQIVRKLLRTKFYRDAHSYLRDELEFTASASNKILRSMSWRRLNATEILTARRMKFKRASLSSKA